MSGTELEEAALAWVREHRTDDARSAPVLADTDLVATGVLDSVAFLDLIGHVERLAGTTIDLLRVDPRQFTTVRGLCGHAVSSVAP
jgi:acyl carrier protein